MFDPNDRTPIDITPYRETIRKYIANATNAPLEDYSTVDPSDRTLPDSLISKRDRLNKIKKPVAMTAGLISAVNVGNPQAFASYLGKSLILDTIKKQQKNAELYEDFEEKLAYTEDLGRPKTKKLSEFIAGNPPAPLLIIALKKLFGDECFGWEPETIFAELADEGVVVTEQLVNKIQCSLLLYLQPDFLNDVLTFENCVRAMSDLNVQWDIFQKPDIAYICWGVAQGLMAMDISPYKPPGDSQFADEVETYIAMALLHDNFVNAPDPLVFAQDTLDKFSKNQDKIRPHLKKRWEEVEAELKAGESPDLDEDLLDRQVGKLVGCWLFMKDKMQEYEELQKTLEAI